MNEQEGHPVILFDGVCNLCEGSVRFIIQRDPGAVFRFAALQSKAGTRLLQAYHSDAAMPDSVVVIESGKVYTHSTAALRICRHLSGLWPLLYGFMIVPRVLRDGVYRWVARNRYRWFGKKEACLMPTPDIQARFLE
ncbi:thiol-disulfide oxidoreductase DCC family protein [Aneurinibacillus uraniidurans]|uniref:thiol-disulfide oxidoreductase DCC family protein n=1 Tax=Aneurinibacillus uraniidurans TaxID=2966586 RepID=UPI00234B2910|nr:thiol-disulfide oxidoreductase DCC family protein [Aneurinibacillus sp. B1]WCN38770.1 thiol-disulfide oxidoreductase DCC family protein [Aneurinibacillus sp. B1]